MHRILPIVAFLMVLSSCNQDNVIYQDDQMTPDGTWSYGEQYSFSFEITDTMPRYRLFTDVIHSPDYEWENFYCRIETRFPGDSIRQDVISFELANTIGDWLGSCNSERCRVSIPLQSRVRFPQPGTYEISFEQHMRDEVVEGIEGIGLRLVELEEDQ